MIATTPKPDSPAEGSTTNKMRSGDVPPEAQEFNGLWVGHRRCATVCSRVEENCTVNRSDCRPLATSPQWNCGRARRTQLHTTCTPSLRVEAGDNRRKKDERFLNPSRNHLHVVTGALRSRIERSHQYARGANELVQTNDVGLVRSRRGFCSTPGGPAQGNGSRSSGSLALSSDDSTLDAVDSDNGLRPAIPLC